MACSLLNGKLIPTLVLTSEWRQSRTEPGHEDGNDKLPSHCRWLEIDVEQTWRMCDASFGAEIVADDSLHVENVFFLLCKLQ